MDQNMKALAEFLNSAHSVFHAVAALEQELKQAGYTKLREENAWELIPGGKYYLTRNGSAILAFRIPREKLEGFLISASHTDRPCFKVKENGILAGTYTRLAVEKYGGAIISPWLDRPLSVAGRVTVETETGVECRLVDFARDLLLIPNVAIHMNRKINEGYAWNPAVDTVPLLGGKDTGDKFWQGLEQLAGGKVLGHDLYLYVRQPFSRWGVEGEFFSAPAIDDLECAWACTQGFLNAKETANIPVLSVFDSEEVGSGSYQGAAADFMESALSRICQGLGLEESCQKAKSFLVSADNGHALHPNHPELSDALNAPVLNGGVVVKYNANQRYTTEGVSAALFRQLCRAAGVAVQRYANRADLPGGSTLGSIATTQTPMCAVDIGLAQLAMHSCYETMGSGDYAQLVQAMTQFFSRTLTVTGESWQWM